MKPGDVFRTKVIRSAVSRDNFKGEVVYKASNPKDTDNGGRPNLVFVALLLGLDDLDNMTLQPNTCLEAMGWRYMGEPAEPPEYVCADCEESVPSMDKCPHCGSVRTVIYAMVSTMVQAQAKMLMLLSGVVDKWKVPDEMRDDFINTAATELSTEYNWRREQERESRSLREAFSACMQHLQGESSVCWLCHAGPGVKGDACPICNALDRRKGRAR